MDSPSQTHSKPSPPEGSTSKRRKTLVHRSPSPPKDEDINVEDFMAEFPSPLKIKVTMTEEKSEDSFDHTKSTTTQSPTLKPEPTPKQEGSSLNLYDSSNRATPLPPLWFEDPSMAADFPKVFGNKDFSLCERFDIITSSFEAVLC